MEPPFIDMGNMSTTTYMNQLLQIQKLQTIATTTAIMEVVTRSHVRFQPSCDLWEDEVAIESTNFFANGVLPKDTWNHDVICSSF